MSTPLVSFGLLSYNQEDFVESALHSAFAQTHDPLEILISDDASTDKTPEIIKRCVDQYQGPHRIRVISPKKNGGLVANVNHVFHQAEGEIVVLAAGDDFSLPHRVAQIVRAFNTSANVMAVHSKTRSMAPDGTLLDQEGSPPDSTLAENIEAIAVTGSVLVGATGAYRKSLYKQFGPIQSNRCYEDLVYGYRAVLAGRLKYIDQVLVHYRVGLGMSAHRTFQTKADRAAHRLAGCLRNVAFLEQRLHDTSLSDHSKKKTLQHLLGREIQYRSAGVTFYQSKARFVRLFFSGKALVAFRVLFKELPYQWSRKDLM